MLTRLIDVSSVQAARIDFPAVVLQGVAGVYHRCGNGNNSPDPNFASRIGEANSAGLMVGAYAVGFPLPLDPAHPGREPEAQAEAHYKQCGGLGSGAGELRPMLDLEWPVPGSPEWRMFALSGAFVRTWALAYLRHAQSLWGVAPLLYDGFPDFWSGIDGASEPAFADFPLWVVDYPAPWQHQVPSNDQLLVVPRPWSKWTMWQHCGGGLRLPGGVPVDGDVFNGDLAALREFSCGRQ
jgi:GH25 family lysozyme M1 (1,4-beta-N-acetylmuramidase)